MTLWAATLGLTAILIGTLSDAWRHALDKLHESHKSEVFTDSLTGVANRRAFEHELKNQITDNEQTHKPLGFLLVDIDYFKNFNDRHGHQTGDAVLAEVAGVIQQATRDDDFVARYGGEEFAVVLPDLPLDQAKKIAERIRTHIEFARFEHNGLKHRLTVSLGLAEKEAGERMSSLIQRADAALYCSKEAGRNCAHFHDGNSSLRFGAGVTTASPDSIKRHESFSTTVDSYCDEITGLPSVRVFVDELRRRAAETKRYDIELAVAIVEVGDYTHMGEARVMKHVLRTIGRLTGSVLREPDLVARYSENQLCILLPWTSLTQARIPMERLNQSAHAYKDVQYNSISFKVSIGLSQLIPGEPAGAVLQRAEEALEAAVASDQHCLSIHNGHACHFVFPQDTPVSKSDGSLMVTTDPIV